MTIFQILNTNQKDQDVVDMLENESSQLSLYSAIATVIPTAQQHSHTVDGVPAVVRLTDNILEIGERYILLFQKILLQCL